MMRVLAYEVVANDLRDQIKQGRLQPGDRLPTGRTLCGTYDVSMATVTNALRRLASEGLIETQLGRGIFVRAPRIYESSRIVTRRPPGQWGQLASTIQPGQHPETRLLHVETDAEPPEFLVGILEGPLVVRHQLFCVNDQPTQLHNSYFPASWAKDTELGQPTLIEQGSLSVIMNSGHELIRAQETVRGRMATPEEAELLELDEPEPLFHLMRIWRGPDSPIAADEGLMPQSHHELRYELPVDE